MYRLSAIAVVAFRRQTVPTCTAAVSAGIYGRYYNHPSSLLKHNNENRGIPLTKVDQKKIIVFLKTLTDKDFLKDTKFSEPQ